MKDSALGARVGALEKRLEGLVALTGKAVRAMREATDAEQKLLRKTERLIESTEELLEALEEAADEEGEGWRG